MKKIMFFKKLVSHAIVILYDIISLFWCYVIIKSMIFEFSTVKIGLNGIDIIGGADIPTIIHKIGNVIGVVFPMLFVLLSIATAFLLTVLVFKKKLNRRLNILLCIFSALAFIVFMLIPRQTYYVSLYISLYTLIRFHKIPLIEHSHIFYMLISLAVIAFNLFSYIKCKREDIK